MSLHFVPSLSPYLRGYRKRFSTQRALILLLQKWKIVLDKKRYSGDTLNHDLLMVKLYAYGFSEKSLKLIKSYLQLLTKNKGQYQFHPLV